MNRNRCFRARRFSISSSINRTNDEARRSASAFTLIDRIMQLWLRTSSYSCIYNSKEASVEPSFSAALRGRSHSSASFVTSFVPRHGWRISRRLRPIRAGFSFIHAACEGIWGSLVAQPNREMLLRYKNSLQIEKGKEHILLQSWWLYHSDVTNA